MRHERPNPFDRLRAALQTGMRFIRHEVERGAAKAPSLAMTVAHWHEALSGRLHSTPAAPAPHTRDAVQGERRAIAVAAEHGSLDPSPERTTQSELTLDSDGHDAGIACDALEAELETVKARVRKRRVRIGARVAAQRRSAHHVEERAQRLEERLDKVRERRLCVVELDLSIARTDVALIASQVELEEAITHLTACERELNRLTTECAPLRDGELDSAAVARDAARRCIERIRTKLKQLYEHGRATRTLDVIACRSDADGELSLLNVITRWRAEADVLETALVSEAASERNSTALRLDSPALRTQLETRLRILVALGEIRVEETEALHASMAEDSSRSRADVVRLSGARIGQLLDAAQRAWLLDTLAAAGHEQGARLPPGGDDAGATALLRAAKAWRTCERRLDEAATQARSVSRDLAALRTALGPALASADAEGKDLKARIRERQSTLRTRTRHRERASSRLDLTRKRRSALETALLRSRARLDRALALLAPDSLSTIVGRIHAFEREVEAGLTQMAGLRAAYDRSLQTMLSMERALLKLGAQTRTPAAPPPESQPQPEPAVTRVAQEIAVLASEVESSKARQAQLEQRVDAHAGLLASLDAGQRDEGALAELRIELEHARLSAEASLQRALAWSPEEARPDVPPASQKD